MRYPKPRTHKTCCACKEIKPLAEFYEYSRPTSIGYSARCRPCHLEHCRELRNSEHGKEVYRKWTKSETGSTSIQKRMATWRDKNKEKRRAHSAISNAIRDNRLKRIPCRICGIENGEAHHLSYDDPYNVDWLCKSCHVKIHYS